MKKNKLIVEIVLSVLVIATVLAYFFHERIFVVLNTIVYVLFAIDYVVRLVNSKKYFHFILNNPIDLLMLLPLNGFFRLLRLYRIVEILNVNSYLKKKFPKITKFLTMRSLGIVLLWIFTFLATISLILVKIEPEINTFFDAFWWTMVTTTTVGYGDIVPSTVFGKIIAIILMLFGIGIVSLLITNITDTLTDKVKGTKDINKYFDKFHNLSAKSQQKIIERIKDEIDFELYKQYKKDKEN